MKIHEVDAGVHLSTLYNQAINALEAVKLKQRLKQMVEQKSFGRRTRISGCVLVCAG